MAHSQGLKSHLDVLQSMINLVLIETGKALRSSNKDVGKALTNTNTRLRGTIPRAIESFHQALDDLECEIIHAKSVLLRDLEELKAKRIAVEDQIPIIEVEKARDEIDVQITDASAMLEDGKETESESLVQEGVKTTLEKRTTEESEQALVTDTSQPVDATREASQEQMGQPISPNSEDLANRGESLNSLGIQTNGLVSAPEISNERNPSIDSLFDVPDNTENGASTELHLGHMDFDLQAANINAQGSGPPQIQNSDFDLSTFGDPSQAFTGVDLNTTRGPGASVNISTTQGQKALGQNSTLGGISTVNMDLDGMAGTEDSVFDDMFFGVTDDGLRAGGELEDEFDNAFFGLND